MTRSSTHKQGTLFPAGHQEKQAESIQKRSDIVSSERGEWVKPCPSQQIIGWSWTRENPPAMSKSTSKPLKKKMDANSYLLPTVFHGGIIVDKTNEQSVMAENKGRLWRPNQSCQPLLPFHPDNAPPSKVKTSPLLNRTLAARLISADYPFKCHFVRKINPA